MQSCLCLQEHENLIKRYSHHFKWSLYMFLRLIWVRACWGVRLDSHQNLLTAAVVSFVSLLRFILNLSIRFSFSTERSVAIAMLM